MSSEEGGVRREEGAEYCWYKSDSDEPIKTLDWNLSQSEHLKHNIYQARTL